MAKFGVAVAAGAALVVLLVPQVGSSRPSQHATAQTTDIMLAFDSTGSMGPSIAAAQREAQALINAVNPLAPGTRYAVASFRDRFYPGGEYTLLSPMTSNVTKLVAAIDQLKSVQSTRPDVDTSAEAYNRLFHETYTDTHIGWRAAARKIVIVIGDAEPHNAGGDGLPGCQDGTKDWDGLDTAKELAAMKAAKRTLVMIRQAGTATTSLACYSSLAAAAYTGGTALDGNGNDIARPVLALVEHAYAPLTITPQFTRGLSGSTGSLTISVANPNTFPLAIGSFTVTLPGGVALVPHRNTGRLPAPTVNGHVLSWSRFTSLPRGTSLLGNVVLHVGNVKAGPASAQIKASTPDGNLLTVTSRAALRFVAHPRRVSVSVGGKGTAGTVRGTISGKLGTSGGSGTLVLSRSAKKSVTLRATAVSMGHAGAPTLLTMQVAVARASGFPSCRVGTAGILHVVDSDALTRSERTHDRLVFDLPGSCGGRKMFTDASAARPLQVKLGFS
jgi:hypothetical protein